MSIPRYDEESHGFDRTRMAPSPYGEWVTLSDHAALLAAKDADIAALKKALIGSEDFRHAFTQYGLGFPEALAKDGHWPPADGSHLDAHANTLPCNSGPLDRYVSQMWRKEIDEKVASARREALEEAATVAESMGNHEDNLGHALLNIDNRKDAYSRAHSAHEVAKAIRALIAAPATKPAEEASKP